MESLDTGVKDTGAVFDIQNDLGLLDSIGESIKRLDALRKENLDSRHAKVTDLGKQLSAMQRAVGELKQSTKKKQVKQQLIELENEMFSIASNLTSYNMEVNSLKMTYSHDLKRLDALELQLQQLKESWTSEQPDTVSERAKMVKLKLYESTGVKIDPARKQVLVVNRGSNKSSVLNVEGHSNYFVTNYIWDSM